jgi:hypothetical protein
MTLANQPHYIRRVIWEAIEMKLQDNFNRERGYQLSSAWTIIHRAKQQEGHHEHTLPTDPMPD